MGEQQAYVRVYWSIIDDPKFADVYDNDGALATWLRLLIAADACWPASANVPAATRRVALQRLVSAGLVDLMPGHRYRIHGLDSERNARSNAGRNAAAMRWQSARNADPMPSRAEPSLVEPSTPVTPTGGGHLNPRSNGTNPRAIAAALTRTANLAAKERKARAHQRYLAYSRGKISEAQRVEMDEADTPLSEIPR